MTDLAGRLETLLGARPERLSPIHISDWAAVERAEMPDGSVYAVKIPRAGATSTCEIEARMLNYLSAESALPVPRVIAVSADALVMDYVAGGDAMDTAAQCDAARHMAALHDISATEFGLSFDTVFGPAPQPNAPSATWVVFYRDRRLLHMAGLALNAGRIDAVMLARLSALAEKLDSLIEEPAKPSLLHGDLWQGNLLVAGGRIAAFIDPAIYYGHAEMDLAFSCLFGTMSSDFFGAYRELRPISPGFAEIRRDIYNLWPLLAHVLFFGGAYLGQVDAILRRHGI